MKLLNFQGPPTESDPKINFIYLRHFSQEHKFTVNASFNLAHLYFDHTTTI